MYKLTNEQQEILSTVLMEYLNIGDWKGLFVQTGSEEFAKQNTHFYEDYSWDSSNLEDNLETDCSKSLAFILSKDSANLKVIWELPGVKTMALRKDENFHAEIEALIEKADIQNTDTVFVDEHQTPSQTVDEAENHLNSNRLIKAYSLIHLALHKFLEQTCIKNEISIDDNDSVSVLHAKVNDFIKKQDVESFSSASLLRTTSLVTETIEDLNNLNQKEEQFTKADLKYAINITRSIMIYIDELTDENS